MLFYGKIVVIIKKRKKTSKMKSINFNGLGLEFSIDSIAFNIFGIDIYWYAIFIVVAFIIGILLCKRDDGKYNIKFENILELLIIAIPVSIICARLYFVLFKLDYYIQNPIEILDIQNGGLAIYGGIIGAIITITIYSKCKKINTLDILDYIVTYVPLRTSNRKMGEFF